MGRLQCINMNNPGFASNIFKLRSVNQYGAQAGYDVMCKQRIYGDFQSVVYHETINRKTNFLFHISTLRPFLYILHIDYSNYKEMFKKIKNWGTPTLFSS